MAYGRIVVGDHQKCGRSVQARIGTAAAAEFAMAHRDADVFRRLFFRQKVMVADNYRERDALTEEHRNGHR